MHRFADPFLRVTLTFPTGYGPLPMGYIRPSYGLPPPSYGLQWFSYGLQTLSYSIQSLYKVGRGPGLISGQTHRFAPTETRPLMPDP